jgi:hypothetical protein
MKIKQNNHTQFLLVVCALASSMTTWCQTWETILDLQDPGDSDAQGAALLIDPYSNESAPSRLYLGGKVGPQASVLIFDQITVTYTQQEVSDAFRVNRIGFNPFSRDLFAATLSYAIPTGRWQVDKQANGGLDWNLADTSSTGEANGFAADDQGNIFVSGHAVDAGSRDHWIVRKSADNGQSWTTVDDDLNAVAGKIHFVPGTNGGLFVVGYQINGSGDNHTYAWLIRRSRDGGATWVTVHNYAGGGNVGAQAITSDAQGTIYVAGWGTPQVVKGSTDGGDTWQTIHTNPAGTEVNDMAVDSAGNLWLVGGSFGWFVLRRDSSGVWQPMEFLGPNSSDINLSSGQGIAIDRAGNVFVTGYIRDDVTLPFRWVLFRRLSDKPVLRTAVSGQNLVLSWPASYQGFMLQSGTTLVNGGDWQDSNLTPTVIGNQNVVNVGATNAAGFFRLRN